MQQSNENLQKKFRKRQKALDKRKNVCYDIGVLNDTTQKRSGKMNKELLEYEMKRKLVGIEDMCKRLSISRSAFYRKCRGISQFTLKEIKTIVETLNLDSPVDIFFAD